jgi:(p)ppGpp synthase/HD superfamily hydrolase
MQTSYHKHCQYSIRLIEKLKSLDTKNVLDFELINKAIYWAKKYHGDQKRKSGEPYYSHPLEVAYMVSDYNLKTDVISASILHDIIEDTEVTAGMILDNFSWRIAEMVDRLTRDRPDGCIISVEEIITQAYKKGDTEVLLIKLIDRLHNLNTLDVMPDEKKRKIALETLNNFVLLALSIDLTMEQSMTKLCFSHLQLNYSQPTFSFVNSRLKPLELESLKDIIPYI